MRRTQLYRVMPWVGGINTSVDPGVLNSQELVQADNVQFSTTGARVKREALEYLDLPIAAPDTRSSSGTVRTLLWTTHTIIEVSPNDQRLVVGERITVTGNSNYSVTNVPILSITASGGGYEITYNAPGSFSEAPTSGTSLTVARASSVILVKDYWHWNGTENVQTLVYATNQFQLFTLDDAGRRTQILGQEQTTAVTVVAASSITGGRHFFISAGGDTTNYYVWYKKAGVGTDPLIAGKTGIEVDIGGTDTNAQVATATAAAIDALADFSAGAVGAVVTITAATAGVTTETDMGNSGFSFVTTAFGATAPDSPVSTIRTNVFNERLQIYFSGIGNFPIIYDPQFSPKYQLMAFNTAAAGLSMPDASFAFNFLSRVWANDKNNPDTLHYSETFDESLWLGFGDSGAIPVNPGDGDPEGVTNAFVYKNLIVASKKDVRYRIVGDSPENFQVQKISDGMGNEGPFSIPIDETDVVFISKRGIHSQQVTDQFGDTTASYLSADIKPTFNTFKAEQFKLAQGAYIPELNSLAISITEQENSTSNDVWLYNIAAQTPNKQQPGAWYRWPDVSCTALSRQFISGKHKLIFGTVDGRVTRAQTENSFADFGTDGILFKIKSGAIYPGDDPHMMKAFKRITMVYRPRGNFSFAVNAKIDNHLSQGFAFNETSGLDLLGETFILGSSMLGSSNVLAPFTFTMEGYGRGVTLTVTQPSADEQIEIWGFIIEYENVGLEQEVQ